MGNSLIDRLFERALKESVVETKTKNILKEAVMNDIPHEIDDVVHSLASCRTEMEDLRKTWESAGFQNLSALDDIIKGIIDLTTLVYTKGAILADQKIGTIGNNKIDVVAPKTTVASFAPVVAPVEDATLKEDDDVAEDSGDESSDEDFDLSDDMTEESFERNEDKELTLKECEDFCSQPCNANLKRAYCKCLQDFRRNKPESSNGEIVKILLTPKNTLKIHFDGVEMPSYAYCDGGVLV